MRLNRPLTHRLARFTITRTDGRPYRPKNYLALACRALNNYLRYHRKLAKADPHLFGPHARRYYEDTVKAAATAAQVDIALRKVYGPPQPGDPPPPPDVWTERYFHLPQWRGFRKYFREHYGD